MIVGLLSNVEYFGLGSIDGNSPSDTGSIEFIHLVLYLLCCLCNKRQVIGILYIPNSSVCWCLVPIREEQSPCGSVLNVPAPKDMSILSLSMTQLRRSGQRTQHCLTPLSTLKSSKHPSVVHTWQLISGYISLMISVR